jgi:hypothetical protein
MPSAAHLLHLQGDRPAAASADQTHHTACCLHCAQAEEAAAAAAAAFQEAEASANQAKRHNFGGSHSQGGLGPREVGVLLQYNH